MSKADKKPEKGLAFPVDSKGERSTSVAGKNIIAAALRGAKSPNGEAYAAKCEAERNWRFKYNRHFMNMVKVSAESPEDALGVARAGADFMHRQFDFFDPKTGQVSKFSDYMNNASSQGTFETGIIKGTGAPGGKPLTMNYKNKEMSGEDLKRQLKKWASYGTIEEDAALSISQLADGPLNLSGEHFVLIGAGSAMGPFYKLLEHGATVVCIDIPGAWGDRPADMWKRLVEAARKSPGTIIFPLVKPQSACSNDKELFAAAGCNLTEQPAQILNWLSSIDKKLTIGNYTYLDGDLHVKLSLAADAIIKHLRVKKPDTAIAFLCTPTDIHVVPAAANAAARKNYGFRPGRILEGLVQILSMGKLLRKNALPPISTKGDKLFLCDGLSVAQGPNYALAKRLQHWRAMIEFEAGGVVSSNIAPSTATLSVVSNKSFGWAYGGMPYFKPFEIFQQETTNAVMAAMLIADVKNKDSAVSTENLYNISWCLFSLLFFFVSRLYVNVCLPCRLIPRIVLQVG
jgi:hypothetical protein